MEVNDQTKKVSKKVGAHFFFAPAKNRPALTVLPFWP